MSNFLFTVLAVGFMAAAAKIIFLAKIGAFRRVLAFDAVLDIAVGSIFGWLFYGTLMGMVIAAIATLTFSGFCYCWKQLCGYDKLTLTGYRPVAPRWRITRKIPVRGWRWITGTILIAVLIGVLTH